MNSRQVREKGRETRPVASSERTSSYFRVLLTMASRQFDIQLISEFSATATDMPIMEWLEDLELTCELCEITKGSATMTKRCGPRNISAAI